MCIRDRVYCFLVSSIHLTFSTVQIIVNVLETPANFIKVMFVIMDTASVIMLTYYRVKMLTAKDVMNDICSKFDIIKKQLDSLGVTVSNKRKELYFCYSHVCIIATIRAAQLCIYLWSTFFHCVRPDLSCEVRSVYDVAMKVTFCLSISSLHIYVICVTFLIQQRVVLFCDYIVSLNTAESRNVAWTVRKLINAANRRRHIKRLRFVCNLIFKVYFDVIHYCKHYFCYAFLLIIFVTTLNLLLNVSDKNLVTLVTMVLDVVVGLVLPVWIVGVIASRLCDIHGMIYKIYYDNPFNQGETLVQEWLVECAHNETGFDCGYFTLDVSTYGAVINFVSLFYFALK